MFYRRVYILQLPIECSIYYNVLFLFFFLTKQLKSRRLYVHERIYDVPPKNSGANAIYYYGTACDNVCRPANR